MHVASTLTEVVLALTGEATWPPDPGPPAATDAPPLPDLADVRGQPVARRALEIAAAGGHHLLMVGSPGSGKTMLAQRLPGLLPPLDRDESLAVTMVHSAAGLALPPGGLIDAAVPRPSPHHVDGRPDRGRFGDTASGGNQPQPWRCALRRRTRRVSARRPRRTARAVGGGRHPRGPCQRPSRPARPLPARRGHQPVPVRRRAARLVRVRRGRPAALRPPPVGAVARPLRPPGGRATTHGRRAAGPRRRRTERRRRPACRRSPHDRGRPGRAAQRRAPRRAARRVRTDHCGGACRAQGGDRTRPADRSWVPPDPPGRPNDRRSRRRGEGEAPDTVDAEHVEVALSLRTRLRAATSGLVA